VHLLTPEAPEWRWGEEVAGLAVITVDEALRSDPDARVVTRGMWPLPTNQSLAEPEKGPWTVSMSFEGPPGAFELVGRVCSPEGDCTTHRALGDRDEPWGAPRQLALHIAEVVGLDEPRLGPAPRSRYAAIVHGRSAATLLGLLPPTDEAASWRNDPVLRATVLDPGPSEAWSLQLRRALADDDLDLALEAARRRVRAGRADQLADYAEVQRRAGSLVGAWETWRKVEPAKAYGPLRLRTAADLARPEALAEVQQLLPADLRRDPEVLRWSAHLWEELVHKPGIDAEQRDTALRELFTLLQAWSDVAPHDEEPLRMLTWLGLRYDRPDVARDAADALRERSGSPEAATAATLARSPGDAMHPARVTERIEALREEARVLQLRFDDLGLRHNAMTAQTDRVCDASREALARDAADHRQELLALRGELRGLQDLPEQPRWRRIDALSGGRANEELQRRLVDVRDELARQAASSVELAEWLTERARRCGDTT
jgi:hypothetical protein